MPIFFCITAYGSAHQEITPYKFTDTDMKQGGPIYTIPASSRFTLKRAQQHSSNIVYYVSKPATDSFPFVLLCGGSSLAHTITSIIHVHRYFLKEFLDLGLGVITIEQQGVDGTDVNIDEFMEHYTRSARLNDHRSVIEHLKNTPVKGWNGKLIFFGVSEGGPLVTTLTSDYQKITLATVNWAGAGDLSWRDELWCFMQDMIESSSWIMQIIMKIASKASSILPGLHEWYFPLSRSEYDDLMDSIIKNPATNIKLAGMTYKYHADAEAFYPKPEYSNIKTPYLVVTGMKDSLLKSSDTFVEKSKAALVPITYMRIANMDHYVRKNEDAVTNTFYWLKDQILVC